MSMSDLLLIAFPYVYIDESSLGGSTSKFIKISLDSRKDWSNGIYHNSRYAIFCIRDEKIELISKHFNMPKFRKCKVKSDADIISKLIKYNSLCNS
jgi:hypothetical protein